MKKLIIVFVLLLSALSCFSQIEFSTCLFDASRNRVIPLAVYQPHKVNSKTKVIILIGHSNGGDMTMLFATRYPQLINKAISMDHRRMIMPRTRNPRLYTLRGCDYDADSGVLPTEKEQEQFRMKVVKLDGITHSNMGENGTEEQHNLINQYIYGFLTRR